jgi:hypothetical protein
MFKVTSSNHDGIEVYIEKTAEADRLYFVGARNIETGEQVEAAGEFTNRKAADMAYLEVCRKYPYSDAQTRALFASL